MSRLALVLSLLLLAALPAAADAKVRKGPSGAAFYTPPSALVGGSHGSLIWARKLTGKAALKGGAGNRLLLYRSKGVNGKSTAVSGTLAIPKGHAPKGGWPLISWAHGTTGIADACAPSRSGGSGPALLGRWLKAGYAVVRTDYEGLGTPGEHPYLIGRSEGSSVLDAARAARKLDNRIGKRFVIAGHSQGGQSALWAASMAPSYTSDLKLRGTVAFAPASHLAEQSTALPNLTSPSALTGLAALILRGHRHRAAGPRRARRAQRRRRAAVPAHADRVHRPADRHRFVRHARAVQPPAPGHRQRAGDRGAGAARRP